MANKITRKVRSYMGTVVTLRQNAPRIWEAIDGYYLTVFEDKKNGFSVQKRNCRVPLNAQKKYRVLVHNADPQPTETTAFYQF